MEHIETVDPQKEWPKRYGFWIRVRGLLTFAGLDGLVIAGTFIAEKPQYALALFAIGIGFIPCLVVMRMWYLRQSAVDIALHNFAHAIRDSVDELLTYSNSSTAVSKLSDFQHQTASFLADYFRTIKHDHSIGCCIRLATFGTSGEMEYVTVARSPNLEQSRKDNSVPIPSGKGVAALLMAKRTQGVIVIRDISKAIEDGHWLKTPNDSCPDVATVMIAPINGFQNGVKAMLGILYITSKIDKFRSTDTIPMKTVADLLGLSFARLYGHFSQVTLAPPSAAAQTKRIASRTRKKKKK